MAASSAPRSATSSQPHVAVVGAGVVGACTAYELARRGVGVVVLERGADWATGCSWGNAGLLCPSFSAPIASPQNLLAGLRWLGRRDAPFGLSLRPELVPWIARYARASLPRTFTRGEALMRELSLASLALADALDGPLDLGLVRRGCLSVYTGALGAAHAAADAASPAGRALGATALDRARLRAQAPALDVEDGAGGVHYPHDVHCDPVRVTRAIGAAAQAAGAQLRTGVEVRAIERDGDGVRVRLSDGDAIACSDVVVAAGAWSGRLAASLGVRLPMQGGKGFALEYDADAAAIEQTVYLHDQRCVATPMGDRLRVTGGLLLRGLDERLEPRRIDAIRRTMRDVLGIAGAPRTTWSGLRPCTPDGLPVIGRHRAAERVVFATGHGMLGLTLGPLTGRAVAELVVGGEPEPAWLAALSPERFGVRPGRRGGTVGALAGRVTGGRA